ncbi:MAG: endo-1,4-beta-xylanase [Phycisphaeraceae bacterium]
MEKTPTLGSAPGSAKPHAAARPSRPPALGRQLTRPVEVELSLRSYSRGLRLGCAIDDIRTGRINDAERTLLLKHFDVLTPENSMKPALIQPTEGAFQFDAPDALVDFAEAHGLDVVGHCLVWHQQCPDWFFKDGDAPAGRELVLKRMRKHIDALVGRYRGRVLGWDVVNEAIDDKQGFFRPTPWIEHVGEDFIEHAFRYAQAADPKAELYYNDYNIEQPAKRDKTLRLLRQLQDANVRLDGVGIQGHWILDRVPFDDIEDAILAYHELGLKVMITELDIDVVDRPDCGADVSLHAAYTVEQDVYRDGCPLEVLERQADQYARLFELFYRHRDKVDRVSFWGLHDGKSWLNEWPGQRTNHPLLFDRDCQPKAAYHRVIQLLNQR